jgi:hypothetical protein
VRFFRLKRYRLVRVRGNQFEDRSASVFVVIHARRFQVVSVGGEPHYAKRVRTPSAASRSVPLSVRKVFTKLVSCLFECADLLLNDPT